MILNHLFEKCDEWFIIETVSKLEIFFVSLLSFPQNNQPTQYTNWPSENKKRI